MNQSKHMITCTGGVRAVARRLRDGDRLVQCVPTENVDGVEDTPFHTHLMKVRQVHVHAPHVGCSSRTQSCTDGHEGAGGYKTGECE